MGERENAIAQGVLVPYTPEQRDRRELELAEEHNKVNLMERRNAGMRVILYWLRKQNVITIYVEDERINASYEYEVEADGCLDAYEHGFSPGHVELRHYHQSENDGA